MMNEVIIMAVVFTLVFTLIGCGVASLIYFFCDTESYNTRMDLLKAFDAQWAVLALIVFNFTVTWLNTQPWPYKEPFKLKGNLRVNMYFH